MSNNNLKTRKTAAELLDRIFFEGAYSHLALNKAFREQEFPSVDKRFITELVYGTVKRKNTLDYVLGSCMKAPFHKTDRRVQTILRMTAYQLLFMDRVPDRAAIHQGVELAKQWGRSGLKGFVNGVSRSVSRKGLPDFSKYSTAKRIALETSHPEWLIRRWLDTYGDEETVAIAKENTKRAQTALRVNGLKATRKALQEALVEEGIQTERGKLAKDSLIVLKGSASESKRFFEGLFSFQDESSMLVAHALDVQPEMSVLDACAAPGGKACHIAERMQDRGRVVANDIHQHKQGLIEAQAARLKLSCIETSTGDAVHLPRAFPQESFDRILVDAPCSGLGVVKAKPDIKWNTNEADIAELPALQYNILQAVASLLKPGGLLVYSTCTILPDENEEVTTRFLRNNNDFQLEQELGDRLTLDEARAGFVTILPHQYKSDGFYIAALRKRQEIENGKASF